MAMSVISPRGPRTRRGASPSRRSPGTRRRSVVGRGWRRRRHGARRYVGHRVDAGVGEAPLPVGEQRRDLADRAADRGRVEPAGDPADVRQVPQRRPASRRRSRGSRPGPRPGVWVSASPGISVRSAVDLPLCGPPTTATCPAAPARSSHSTSRRCSQRLVDDARSAPAARPRSRVGRRRSGRGPGRPRPGRAARRASAPRASGGSHTWCAGDALAGQPVDDDVQQAPGRLVRRLAGGSRRRRLLRRRARRRDRVVVGRDPAAPVPPPHRLVRAGWCTAGHVRRLEPGQRLGAGLAGSRGRASAAARTRPATPSTVRDSSGGERPQRRSGRTGACPARAAGPPRAAGWPAAGARPSERPTRPIWTNRSMKSGLAASSSVNSSQTTSRRRQRRAAARRPARARS